MGIGTAGVVIAAIVAYIAWQQHKTNRDKLRLDLYNKRYEVFHGLKTLLARIAQQANVKSEQVDEFSRATKEAVFLFDEGIETYLETIRKKANDLWATEEIMNPLPKGKERSAKVAEVRELCDWFTEQSDVTISKFGKYLDFEQKLEGKAMNWKRGFRRITHILAPVGAGFSFYVGGETAYQLGAPSDACFAIAFLSIPVGYCLVWLIYYLVEWLILGFCEDRPKAEQKQ